jgi:hypothetical protein
VSALLRVPIARGVNVTCPMGVPAPGGGDALGRLHAVVKRNKITAPIKSLREKSFIK